MVIIVKQTMRLFGQMVKNGYNDKRREVVLRANGMKRFSGQILRMKFEQRYYFASV